jgi:hypothetical protein
MPDQPDETLAFGFDDSAVRAVDEFDLPQPPAPPGTTLQVSLVMDRPADGLPDRWSRDIRQAVDFRTPPGLYYVELWHMQVVSTAAVTLIADLVLTGTDPAPMVLRLVGPGGPTDVGVDGAVTIPAPPGTTDFYWEVSADREVGEVPASWSTLKAIYR